MPHTYKHLLVGWFVGEKEWAWPGDNQGETNDNTGEMTNNKGMQHHLPPVSRATAREVVGEWNDEGRPDEGGREGRP